MDFVWSHSDSVVERCSFADGLLELLELAAVGSCMMAEREQEQDWHGIVGRVQVLEGLELGGIVGLEQLVDVRLL